MFQKAKDMYKMQKQAKEIKKELKNIHIEAEEQGVKIVINAEMDIISVNIEDASMQDKKSLEQKIQKAFEKAIKKAQQIAAEKMRGLMGNI